MPDKPDEPARVPGPIRVSRASDMSWSGIQTFAKLPLGLTPADLHAGNMDVAIGGGAVGRNRHRCVMEALTGTAMRRMGLTQPDYADPRARGGNRA